jgi:hypothetical protein
MHALHRKGHALSGNAELTFSGSNVTCPSNGQSHTGSQSLVEELKAEQFWTFMLEQLQPTPYSHSYPIFESPNVKNHLQPIPHPNPDSHLNSHPPTRTPRCRSSYLSSHPAAPPTAATRAMDRKPPNRGSHCVVDNIPQSPAATARMPPSPAVESSREREKRNRRARSARPPPFAARPWLAAAQSSRPSVRASDPRQLVL